MNQKNAEFRKKAIELVGKMTLEERASQLRFDAPAVERLGVPAYNWWNEGLHGLARAGTATMFPQAIALASMFDSEKLYEVADIISTETRAKYNMSIAKEDRDIYKGLTLWSPNINIFRDPRWGRGHETYGEDPYLTATLGAAFVKGLQQLDNDEYMKTAACAKHFAVHSGPEESRHEFDAIATQKDMRETYLPAFEVLVKEAGVESVMGAYNRTNGEPCCGSKTLLKDILRDEWGFEGHVVSDCWAICDFHLHHHVTNTPAESAAMALKNGCDVNCGNMYQIIMTSYELGLVTEEEITTAAVNLFTTRFKLGMFDESCKYDKVPYSVIESPEHMKEALVTAEKSMVLLKNDNILPLDKKAIKSIAVIGPTADSREVLKGNYAGTSSNYVTILEGIKAEVSPDTRVFYSEGSHLYKNRVENLGKPNDRLSEAMAVAEMSDVVVLCLGLDSSIEGEQGDTGNAFAAGDKIDLGLPETQRNLLDAVLSVKKPTILMLSTGSAMDLNLADEKCAAIIQTWYCGALGGTAAANILFGKANPSAKLPVTFYRSLDSIPAFEDYSMKGRTYRYINEVPLYSFGYGLSYSTIEYANAKSSAANGVLKDGEALTISVDVKNTSDRDCEEVSQVYVKVKDSAFSVKHYSLCSFARTALKAGETKTITFSIDPAWRQVVTDEGEKIFDGSGYVFYIGGSQPDEASVSRLGKKPVSLELGR